MESPKIDYIQSKDNKTIKHIISLQQRKYRQKFGEYTVEGIRAVTDIGKKDFLRSILIRESKRSAKRVYCFFRLCSTRSNI